MRPATSTRVLFIGSIALALTLAACGGGGGGGTGPVPGGGNGGGGPTATPTPVGTGSPKATPTPTATPVHTATPAPTATPVSTPTPTTAPQSITMLPDTTGRFGLTQILDNYGGEPALTTAQIQSEAPHYDSVWGTFSPTTWSSAPGAESGMVLSRYVLDSEDMNLISGHDLSWWQANHPDWIFYTCDSSGNPTHYLAWDEGYFTNDVPLAYWMPQVQQYEQNLWISYLQQNHYTALAADNMNLTNYTVAGNPNNSGAATPPSGASTYFGCGTYDTSGNFVRRYSSRSDSTYTSDTITWAANMANALHSNGLKLLINHPVNNAPTDPNEQSLLSHVDGMVDENGYTHYGTLLTNSSFDNTLQWVEYTQAHNIAVLVTDYFCTGSGCSNDPSTLTQAQVDWALATYALGNNGGEDVYISPHGGSNYSYRNEYNTRYGAACGAYASPASYVYVRKFQGGLAVANASGSSYALTLPSGHTYTDIEGRAVSNPLTVNPSDGYFLLTSNGCS
ncbi:MAG TPA: hypothetical protein VFL13_12985 [Candidatus Baltobacteraceae bacterium]|nr:hypothetical protein [Candidatus Baltobacteraceae bacterium]